MVCWTEKDQRNNCQAPINFCPRSRLSFWSREEGSAFPPRVGSPILHTRAESGAYSRAPLLLPAFRDGAAAVCLPLPLVRTIWLVGLAEVAPPTPSNALLVDQIRSHELRSTSACSPSRSLTLSSLPQGLILPQPGSSRGGRSLADDIQGPELEQFISNQHTSIIRRDKGDTLALLSNPEGLALPFLLSYYSLDLLGRHLPNQYYRGYYLASCAW